MPTIAASGRTLSKSDYKLARTCDAKLYFRENRYTDRNESNPYLRMFRLVSFMMEAFHQAKRPDGILCEYGRDIQGDSARTLELLQRDRVTLFQGTLLWGRRLARFDILEKNGSTIRLVEVKSSSIDGTEHKANIAEGGKG